MKTATMCASMLVLAACGGEPAPTKPSADSAAPATRAPAAQTLEAVSNAFADARAASDAAPLVELTKALLPGDDDLRRVLKAGPETDAFLAKYDAARLRADANEVAQGILKPSAGQSVARVHSATTEELAAYAKGSVAYAEFAGGSRDFAKAVAAPGRVWQAIEYLKPGEERGMKYALFTVLDGRVIFLMKPWRALAAPK